MTLAAAHAGSYTVSYSGGATTVTLNGVTAPAQNYSPTGPNWGGSGDPANGGPVNFHVVCQGLITATFTWVAGYTGELPPPSVIVQQYCNANYDSSYVQGAVVTGSGSNGLGAAVVTTASGASWASTLYAVKNTPGTSFSITCNPSVTWSGSGTFFEGSASVSYHASATPASITLQGTTPDANGKPNILNGQGCTASLSGIPSDLLNNTAHPPTYQWGITGSMFQYWSPTTPAHGTTPANPNASDFLGGRGPLNKPTAHWYFNDPFVVPKTETVTCTVTLTPPAEQGASFSVMTTQKVIVQEIAKWSAYGQPGHMQVNKYDPDHPSNTIYKLWAGPTDDEKAANLPVGMLWQATV